MIEKGYAPVADNMKYPEVMPLIMSLIFSTIALLAMSVLLFNSSYRCQFKSVVSMMYSLSIFLFLLNSPLLISYCIVFISMGKILVKTINYQVKSNLGVFIGCIDGLHFRELKYILYSVKTRQSRRRIVNFLILAQNVGILLIGVLNKIILMFFDVSIFLHTII